MVFASSAVETLDEAVIFHMALVLIRGGIAEALRHPVAGTTAADREMTIAIRTAIESACKAVSIGPDVFGLTFRPVISALAEVGRQIHGQTTSDLGVALAQRSRLLLAKRSGWPSLRAAWVEVLQQGRSGSVAEAEAIVDGARRAHAPRRAEVEAQKFRRQEDAKTVARRNLRETRRSESIQQRHTREFASAVQAVERTLAKDKQQATAVARQEVRAEREKERLRLARQRWASDPQRTTEELLAGPPLDLR